MGPQNLTPEILSFVAPFRKLDQYFDQFSPLLPHLNGFQHSKVLKMASENRPFKPLILNKVRVIIKVIQATGYQRSKRGEVNDAYFENYFSFFIISSPLG